jgi:hypothetical protein
LGETGPTPWFNGQITTDIPRPIILGDASDLTLGQIYPAPAVPRSFVGGWDSRCFAPLTDGQAVLPIDLVDIEPRANKVIYAQILDLLYDDPPAAVALAQAFFGADAIVTMQPNNAGAFPGSIIVTTPTFSAVIVSGTTTPQQLAMQALYAGAGPLNVGAYGTNPIWLAASISITDRMRVASVDATKPIILVGHSYGGAVASVTAARLLLADPGRDVRLLTFGSPRPGDARLQALLSRARQIHVANVGDPVPLLPPIAPDTWPLAPFVPGLMLNAWNQWRSPGGTEYLRADGSVYQSPQTTLLFDTLLAIALAAVAGTPFAFLSPHTIKAYLARLQLSP